MTTAYDPQREREREQKECVWTLMTNFYIFVFLKRLWSGTVGADMQYVSLWNWGNMDISKSIRWGPEILIRKRLFWSDHVAIYAIPYGLTNGRVPRLRYFWCLFWSDGNIQKICHHLAETLGTKMWQAPWYSRFLQAQGMHPSSMCTAAWLLLFVLFIQKKT